MNESAKSTLVDGIGMNRLNQLESTELSWRSWSRFYLRLVSLELEKVFFLMTQSHEGGFWLLIQVIKLTLCTLIHNIDKQGG